jgi:hypothetical protein
MPVSLQVLSVVTRLAALPVTFTTQAGPTDSVNILDLNELKDEFRTDLQRNPNVHILAPRPASFFRMDNLKPMALNTGPDAEKNITYTLTYVYFHCPVGVGRGYWDIYPDAVRAVVAVWNVLIANDTLMPAINLWPPNGSSPNIEVMLDAKGNKFWGALVPIQILELIN